MIDGFVLVDKAGGPTSHDVVAKIRRLAGQKKVGHAGTLDPMATGLVVVGLGRCTRLLRYVQDQPKTYVATARFGIATDSLDADGREVGRAPLPVARGQVEGLLDEFRGRILQIPPMVSALKRDGRRLHELAREGVEVEREPREVDVFELTLIDVGSGDYPEVSFRVRCGSGTYIRSLADDIARSLGGRAHLTALRRTHNGGHSVAAGYALDALERMERFADAVVAPSEGIPEIPVLVVDDETASRVAHGRPFAAPRRVDDGAAYRVVHDGRLLAVYRTTGTQLKPEVVLV